MSHVLLDQDGLEAFADRLAQGLGPGDCLALEGPLGAGKSTFARRLIRALLCAPEADVPSPTFTLVQTYETPAGLSICHADLYRLSEPAELIELALEDMFATHLCLIEWPDRASDLLPPSHVTLHLDYAGAQTRHVSVTGKGALAARVRAGLNG